jgi:catechol 2,3-dioxygenase-like lactoylglutathione lyase family enzyme
MKIPVAALAFVLPAICAYSQTSPSRPRILGIDHVSFYTTNSEGVKKLFGNTLGLTSAPPVEPGLIRYMVGRQWIGYSAAPDPSATDRLDHVAFSTDNAAALRQYLVAHRVKVPAIVKGADGGMSFALIDPEGHRVEFVERAKLKTAELVSQSAVSRHLIHAGFVVYHRNAEDRFYRDILGFRLYWHGASKDGQPDEWVAMQVPDGTDWLEYMLNQPQHMDLKLTGIMNHISLGVADMKKAQAMMESHGWKPHGDEAVEIGRDGKWQLDVFDPDFSRVELMDFKPTQKPCCFDFTGQHPSE